MWKRFAQMIVSSFADEEHRQVVIFNLLNLLLAGVALVMTAVNWNTRELELMMVTAAFSLLCLGNVGIIRRWPGSRKAVFTAFSVEAEVLLVYFVLGGVPEGFSVLWTLLVPAVGMSVFGIREGMRFAALTLGMIAFFFWVPAGRALLYYDYNQTFMLRFPFVYICLMCASAYVETIRLGAYNRLKEMEETARYLYRHDALTGAYTRYAFFEELTKMFDAPSSDRVSAVVYDVDDFKQINDRFGHNAGDVALKTVAKIIMENTCEHCVVCRWGGEEFLVLMRCGHDPWEISQRIRGVVEDTGISFAGQELRVTVSVGIAVADSLTREQLSTFINCADKAMYASKQEGKNRIRMEHFRTSES